MGEDYVTVERSRSVGIEVDGVRPVWQRVIIEWPDGTIPADEWDEMSVDTRRRFLAVTGRS